MAIMLVLLLLLVPLGLLALLTRWCVLSPALRPASRNAIATGIAAASMVHVFFILIGAAGSGPWASQALEGWWWRTAVFATVTGLFAWVAGWACAVIWLALREAMARRKHGPRAPSEWALCAAVLALLALALAYQQGVDLLSVLMCREHAAAME